MLVQFGDIMLSETAFGHILCIEPVEIGRTRITFLSGKELYCQCTPADVMHKVNNRLATQSIVTDKNGS